MDEDRWQRARLIPTWGISSAEEAERRATSALLAVLGAVREFNASLLRPLGAPAGTLETFIEVEFDWNGAKRRPDGLIRIRRGQREWVCLVEVKTGAGVLEREQVECYLDIARENDFDALLTISNQICETPGQHPVAVDKRKLRRVQLHHLSWAEVLTTAVVERVHRKVSDPDQAWILEELIRYLEAPGSGALAFTDLGADWTAVRDAAAMGTLRASDKGVIEVARRWDQLLRLVALRLGRDLGADTQIVLSRKELADPGFRRSTVVSELLQQGSMSGSIRIAGTVGAINVTADVRHSVLHLGVGLNAPTEGRPNTRVNWLTRQLPDDAPRELRVEAWALHARQPIAALLHEARENPTVLVDEQGRELRAFRVAYAAKLGTKRGVDRGSFVASLVAGIDFFYEQVVQNLRPWATRAPRLPKETSLADAGVDVTPEPDTHDHATGGPDGTLGAADRYVARDQTDLTDDDPSIDQLDESVITDEEIADWLRTEVSEPPLCPVADHTEQATPGLPTLTSPESWAAPGETTAIATLPPPLPQQTIGTAPLPPPPPSTQDPERPPTPSMPWP